MDGTVDAVRKSEQQSDDGIEVIAPVYVAVVFVHMNPVTWIPRKVNWKISTLSGLLIICHNTRLASTGRTLGD